MFGSKLLIDRIMPYSDPHIVVTTVVELANTDDNVSVLEVTLARDIKRLISEGFANELLLM